MFFEETKHQTELLKPSTRSLRAAERRVADYCSIRATMREMNRRLTLDEEFDAVTPMNG